jgi:hypothetical protein
MMMMMMNMKSHRPPFFEPRRHFLNREWLIT